MPTLIDAGETWSSPTYEVRDSAGALTSGATVTAAVTLPDGTTATPTPTNTGTGTYALDYLTSTTAALVGAHDVVITATGGPLGSIVRKWSDTFETVAAGGLLFSADDLLAHLRRSKLITGAADMDHLRWIAYVATNAVSRDLGRAVVREVVTEKHDGGSGSVRLRRTPVRSVTSVKENGVTLSATDGVDWTLDAQPRTGLLHRGGTVVPDGSCVRWACGRANVEVGYVAGPVGSPVVRWVGLEAGKSMWQNTQQAAHPLVDDVTADDAVFSASAELNRVDRDAYDSLRAAAGLGLA